MWSQKYYLFNKIRQPNLPVYKCVYHFHPLLSLVSSLSTRQTWLPQIAGNPWGVPLYPGEKEKQAPWSRTPAPRWSGFLPSSACFLPFLLNTLYRRLTRPNVWFWNVPFFPCKVHQPDQCPPIQVLWRGRVSWNLVLTYAQLSLACSEFIIFVSI